MKSRFLTSHQRRRLRLVLFALLAAFTATAQEITQTFYIDFGENDVSGRGSKTSTADSRGNFWSNVTSPGAHNHIYPQRFALVNSRNENLGYGLEIGSFFNTNGMSGGGGLTNPSESLLGDLAVATATQDYMFLETWADYNIVRFVGLNAERAYRFYTFGSRATDGERTGYFEFRGENSWSGELQMSGAGLGANGYNGNNRNVLVSEPVFPDRDGTVTLTISKKIKNGMVHVNCMKVEELSGLPRANAELQLVQTMLIDFGETSNDTRGHETTGKDSFGQRWNNISTGSSSSHTLASRKSYFLYNTDNSRAGCMLRTLDAIKTNGIDAGGLNAPDEKLLGKLAVQTATEDYIFTDNDDVKSIEFSRLDKEKCYRFYLLGHRATSEGDRRSSWYQISGQHSWECVQLNSGAHVGGEGVHGNTSNVAVSDYIFPDADGIITFRMKRNSQLSSSFSYLNVMRIEEYSGGVRPKEPLRLASARVVGSACEDGKARDLNELLPNGISHGVFETYMRVRPGRMAVEGTTPQGSTLHIGLTDGVLTASDNPDSILVEQENVVRIRIDSEAETITLTPVVLQVKGNIVSGTPSIPYVGDGIFEGDVSLSDMSNQDFNSKYFYFLFNNDENLAVRRLTGTRTTVAMPAEGFSTENIRINQGTYHMQLDMNRYEWTVDAPIDEFKISAFGSSVCNGQGANSNHGYAYQYGTLLSSRFNRKLTERPFKVVGTSIGGNTTNNLLNRYDEVIHDYGRYVIIGLSMGNEGVHDATDKQSVLNQFSTNLQKIIRQLRADGRVPVVMNNYTRSDYTLEDYSYIKKINLDIHRWDVPSVNTLGAIDDGYGRWAEGFIADAFHPNTEGHTEFMYAIPPSLFDALAEGKPLPVRKTSGSLTLSNGSTLSFTGENVVHSFTVTLRIRGNEDGQLLRFMSGTRWGRLRLKNGGYVEYVPPTGTSITSAASLVTDETKWYNITLTHYYAQQRTLLYVNQTLVGEISERLTPTRWTVGDGAQALHRQYSELSFWRSAMCPEEVAAHNSGYIMRSSLELYAPLDDTMAGSEIPNLAQSTNSITFQQGEVPDAVERVLEEQKSQPLFSPDGRRLQKPARGVNITQGRKFLSK